MTIDKLFDASDIIQIFLFYYEISFIVSIVPRGSAINNKSHVLQNLLINATHVVEARGEAENVAPSAFDIMMQMINDHLSALHSRGIYMWKTHERKVLHASMNFNGNTREDNFFTQLSLLCSLNW